MNKNRSIFTSAASSGTIEIRSALPRFNYSVVNVSKTGFANPEMIQTGTTFQDSNAHSHSLQYSEKWGYVTVRPGAHMFWWLYQASNVSEHKLTPIHRPLIIWLQGGPGDSGTGYGNFQEIGPLDINLKRRNATWLTRADLLFVDCPVGAGFSFVDSEDQYVTTLDDSVDDLMNFTYAWTEAHEKYVKDRSVFIFGESYGGKIAVSYARRLHQHIQQEKRNLNLQGIGLGNSWISPIDFMLSWPDFLYYHSWLSPRGLADVRLKTEECHNYSKVDLWVNATKCLQHIAALVSERTSGVSWYNILKHDKTDAYSKKLVSGDIHYAQLENLMNGEIKDKLGIIPDKVQWGSQSDAVYFALYDEMMRSAVHLVDEILEKTELHVFIYNGQLDLICNTPGVQTWMKKLKWPKMGRFYSAERRYIPYIGFTANGAHDHDMFMQRYEQLWFFWVLRAGHNVPADAPEASLKVLDIALADLFIKEGLRKGR